MSKTPTARLDRLLANLGYGSRREVQALVERGQVVLDGAKLDDASARLPVTADLPTRMRVQGAPLDPPAPLSLILHKPLGVVCSHRETGRTVYELLPARWRRRDPALSTIGRLDLDTTGLLLITDDGPFLHRVISPRSHVAKRYRATLDRPLQGHEAGLFASGELMLDGETTPLRPAMLEPLSDRTANLTITEGRYHQVRRMFAAVGNHVVALHRDRIGGLDLPADLAEGRYRLLSETKPGARCSPSCATRRGPENSPKLAWSSAKRSWADELVELGPRVVVPRTDPRSRASCRCFPCSRPRCRAPRSESSRTGRRQRPSAATETGVQARGARCSARRNLRNAC